MESKKESIKLRVTKKEKDKLLQLSKEQNESLSSYILRKCLEDIRDSYPMPEKIGICNFMNEIYHEIEKYGNQQLKRNIRVIYQNYAQNHESEV